MVIYKVGNEYIARFYGAFGYVNVLADNRLDVIKIALTYIYENKNR